MVKLHEIETSECRSLPPEVWINVFSFHSDLAHLWTVCRRISPILRSCAEHAFADYFLSEIHIDFQLEKYNLGGRSKRPEIPVTFDRLGKRGDKGTVWFKDKRLKRDRDKSKQEQFELRRWQENVQHAKPEMPNYTISICGLVNDTALPKVEINIEEREIQFAWKDMLQLFYREHERVLSLKKIWQKQTARQLEQIQSRTAGDGETLKPAEYPLPWAVAEAEIRKQVRRARLKKSYSDDEQMVWAIDSLKHFEQYGAAGGNARSLKINPIIPGSGLGEKWFGSVNLVQELYLDEWSCMHRIDTKVEHLRTSR